MGETGKGLSCSPRSCTNPLDTTFCSSHFHDYILPGPQRGVPCVIPTAYSFVWYFWQQLPSRYNACSLPSSHAPWACPCDTSFHSRSWLCPPCGGLCCRPSFDQRCAHISCQLCCGWLPPATFRRLPLGRRSLQDCLEGWKYAGVLSFSSSGQ